MHFCRLPSASYSKKYFMDIIRVSNNLDPVQVKYFVGPDLGSNCLVKVVSGRLIDEELNYAWFPER